ncbi:MAG: leucine-rich repeat domain-containing protein [Mycoplasmoidaceae bacterium]|nr:leucine-rich repeat domain-containing protein [Mycoplasmoidaceae bacterium]
MIKVAKILSLSLISTISAGTATVVPTLCLSTDSPSQPIFYEPRPIDTNLLNIDEYGVLHGFKDDVTDSQLKDFNTLQIPDNVTAIGPYAFAYRFDGQLNKINAIDFSQATNLVSIGDNAFNYCYAIESDIDFSNCLQLASIGLSAFFFCTSIKTLKFASSSPTDLTIGDHAFFACEALKTLNLYQYIKEIKNNAFEQCVGLDTINVIGFASLPT